MQHLRGYFLAGLPRMPLNCRNPKKLNPKAPCTGCAPPGPPTVLLQGCLLHFPVLLIPMPHTILALHYFAGSGHDFDSLRPLLPATTRLLAPDLPGFGAALIPAGFDFSVRAYVDWVADYVAREALTDFTLLGHSMGGKIALALAARQPAALRQLVLLSPSPPAGEPMTDEDRAAALAAYGKLAEARKTCHKITQQPLTAAVQEAIIADNLRCSQEAWDA